jgi:hypothetical protein
MKTLVLHLILAAAISAHPAPRQVERAITAHAATAGVVVEWRKRGIPVWVVPGWRLASRQFCGKSGLLGCEWAWVPRNHRSSIGRLASIDVIAQDWSGHLAYELAPYISKS